MPELPAEADITALYAQYGRHKGYAPPRDRARFPRFNPPNDPCVELLKETGGLRGASLLEVGCSYGAFLTHAQREGATVAGVELDESALAHLSGLGIPVGRTIDHSQRYDVVCAFQVLEHLEHPAEIIAGIAEVLRPDGRLLVSVPNGAEGEMIGAGWVGYRVDLEHFNYFSVGTLSSLLLKHDLYVEQFWEHTAPAIGRVNGCQGTTWTFQRIRRKLGFRQRSMGVAPHAAEGTFVLTALARKG